MEKMEVDDVVDLSMGRDSLTTATVRDLQALTQNAGLTITPAPPSAVSNGIFQDFFISSLAVLLETVWACVNFVANRIFAIARRFYRRFGRQIPHLLHIAHTQVAHNGGGTKLQRRKCDL